MFKEHSQMMRRVLERSSSDDSEEIKNMMDENQENLRYQGRMFASDNKRNNQ